MPIILNNDSASSDSTSTSSLFSEGYETFNDKGYSNFEKLESKGKDITDEYNAFNETFGDEVNMYGQTYEDAYKNRAKKQSALSKLWGFAAQSVANELILGTLRGFSDLVGAGLDALGVNGDDRNYSNSVSGFFEKAQDKVRNAVPIYQENLDNGLHPDDFGWWTENAVSAFSTASLLIPSLGITKGLSTTGKFLKGTSALSETSKIGKFAREINLVNKAGKVTNNVANKLGKLMTINEEGANALASYLGKINAVKNPSKLATTLTVGSEQVGTAFFSRTMENYQEARETYNNTYDINLNNLNNMTKEDRDKFILRHPEFGNITDSNEQIAKKISTSLSDEVFKNDYAMLIFDIMELYALRGIWKGTVGGGTSKSSLVANENLTRGLSKGLGRALQKGDDGFIENTLLNKLNTAAKYYSKNPLDAGKAFLKTPAFTMWNESIEEGYQGIEQAKAEEQANRYFDSSVKYRSLSDYLSDSSIQNQALWGYLGGIIFQSTGNALGHARTKYKKYRAKKEFDAGKISQEVYDAKIMAEDYRGIKEIEMREKIFKDLQNDFALVDQGINPMRTIRNEEGKLDYAKIRPDEKDTVKELLLNRAIKNMTYNAIDSGNYNLLMDMMNDKEFSQYLSSNLNSNISNPADIENIKHKMKETSNNYINHVENIINNTDADNEYVIRKLARELSANDGLIEDIQNDINNINSEIANLTKDDNNDYTSYYNKTKADKIKFLLNILDNQKKVILNDYNNKKTSKKVYNAQMAEINKKQKELIKNLNANSELLSYLPENDKESNTAYINALNEYILKYHNPENNRVEPNKILKDKYNSLIDKELSLQDVRLNRLVSDKEYQQAYDIIEDNLMRYIDTRIENAYTNIKSWLKQQRDLDAAYEEIYQYDGTNRRLNAIAEDIDIANIDNYADPIRYGYLKSLVDEIKAERENKPMTENGRVVHPVRELQLQEELRRSHPVEEMNPAEDNQNNDENKESEEGSENENEGNENERIENEDNINEPDNYDNLLIGSKYYDPRNGKSFNVINAIDKGNGITEYEITDGINNEKINNIELNEINDLELKIGDTFEDGDNIVKITNLNKNKVGYEIYNSDGNLLNNETMDLDKFMTKHGIENEDKESLDEAVQNVTEGLNNINPIDDTGEDEDNRSSEITLEAIQYAKDNYEAFKELLNDSDDKFIEFMNNIEAEFNNNGKPYDKTIVTSVIQKMIQVKLRKENSEGDIEDDELEDILNNLENKFILLDDGIATMDSTTDNINNKENNLYIKEVIRLIDYYAKARNLNNIEGINKKEIDLEDLFIYLYKTKNDIDVIKEVFNNIRSTIVNTNKYIFTNMDKMDAIIENARQYINEMEIHKDKLLSNIRIGEPTNVSYDYNERLEEVLNEGGTLRLGYPVYFTQNESHPIWNLDGRTKDIITGTPLDDLNTEPGTPVIYNTDYEGNHRGSLMRSNQTDQLVLYNGKGKAYREYGIVATVKSNNEGNGYSINNRTGFNNNVIHEVTEDGKDKYTNIGGGETITIDELFNSVINAISDSESFFRPLWNLVRTSKILTSIKEIDDYGRESLKNLYNKCMKDVIFNDIISFIKEVYKTNAKNDVEYVEKFLTDFTSILYYDKIENANSKLYIEYEEENANTLTNIMRISYNQFKEKLYTNYEQIYNIQNILKDAKEDEKFIEVKIDKQAFTVANKASDEKDYTNINTLGLDENSKDVTTFIVDKDGVVHLENNEILDVPNHFLPKTMGLYLGKRNGVPIFATFGKMNTFKTKMDSEGVARYGGELYEGLKEELENLFYIYHAGENVRYDDQRDDESKFDCIYRKLSNLFNDSKSIFRNIVIVKNDNAIGIRYDNPYRNSEDNTDKNDSIYHAIIFNKDRNNKKTSAISYSKSNQSYKTYKRQNKSSNKMASNIARLIAQKVSFNKTYLMIKDKENVNTEYVQKNDDGTLRIHIGSFDKTYNSFTSFAIGNNIAKTSQLYENDSYTKNLVDGAQALYVSMSDVNKVETISSYLLRNIDDTRQSKEITMEDLLNATGLSEEVKDVLLNSKNPKTGENMFLQNMTYNNFVNESDAYASYNVTNDKIDIYRRSLYSDTANLLRNIVHENLHRQIANYVDENGNKGNFFEKEENVKNIINLYNYFKKALGDLYANANNKSKHEINLVKKWIDEFEEANKDKSNEVIAEEFLVESVTQKSLINILNEIKYKDDSGNIIEAKVSDVTNKTLWQKILDIILKLFGLETNNIKNNTILAHEYMIIANEIEKTNNNVTTETNTEKNTETNIENNLTEGNVDNSVLEDELTDEDMRVLNDIENMDLDDMNLDDNTGDDPNKWFSAISMLDDIEIVSIMTEDKSGVNLTNAKHISDVNEFMRMFPNEMKPNIADLMSNGDISYVCM